MTETLYIFTYVNNLLEVLVLTVVEDGVVYDNPVDVGVGVGGEDGLFDIIARGGTEGIAEAAVFFATRLVHRRSFKDIDCKILMLSQLRKGLQKPRSLSHTHPRPRPHDSLYLPKQNKIRHWRYTHLS